MHCDGYCCTIPWFLVLVPYMYDSKTAILLNVCMVPLNEAKAGKVHSMRIDYQSSRLSGARIANNAHRWAGDNPAIDQPLQNK